MKKIILTTIFLMATAVSFAQTNMDHVALGNQVLMKIFDEILSYKDRSVGLETLSDQQLDTGANGFYRFEYENQIEGRTPINFGLTIIGLNEPNPFAAKKTVFEYPLPLIDLKFVGYESRNKRFDVKEIMRRHLEPLLEEQQEFMPYKLSVSPDKDAFKIKEPIFFTVTLTNLTKRNIKVKDLNDETLYFLYNNKPWGAKLVEDPTKDKSKVDNILKPNESIKKKFRAAGFTVPKVFEIFGSYTMTYKGVNPTTKLSVTVVESPL